MNPLNLSGGWMGVVALIGVGLAWAEWRRTDRRHRIGRLVATVVAVAALAGLLWRSWADRSSRTGSEPEAVELWTPSFGKVIGREGRAMASAPETGGAAGNRFALPGAVGAPATAVVIPDPAYLRRRFPDLAELDIFGGGIEPGEIAQLRGLTVRFQSDGAARIKPGFVALHVPGQLTLGESLVVEGRIGGMTAGQALVVSLVSPGGEITPVEVRAGPAGEGAFVVKAKPPVALGAFVWRLRLAQDREGNQLLEEGNVGVAVIPPLLPRVLLLESSPRLDSARLRRWLGSTGGSLSSRTRVSRDRFQFSASRGNPLEFEQVDAALLAGFDLLILDGSSLAALSAPERSALRKAVEETGLGILLLPDDELLAGTSALKDETDRAFFVPWQLKTVGDVDTANDRRAVQLTGDGGRPLTAEPIPAVPFAIDPKAGEWGLFSDGQGREVAAVRARGLGRVGLTLVFDTWRWPEEQGAPEAFSAYWSKLFGALARPARDEAEGRWMLEEDVPPPIYVNQRLELRRSGGTESELGVVESVAEGASVRLPLLQDGNEPSVWQAEYWPRRPGWHRMRNEGSSNSLDFYVQAPDEWPGVRAERRKAATTLRAAQNGLQVVPGANGRTAQLPASWLFALFFLAAGYLWIEGRAGWRAEG
jgi:hypothetical protein